MAKISNKTIYPEDQDVSMEDYLIGTNANNFNRTQTYSVQSFFNLFNLAFKFSNGSDPSIDYSTKGYFFSEDNETDPSQVTRFYFNNRNLLGQNITALFQLLAEQGSFVLRLTNSADPNNVIFISCSNVVFDTLSFSFDPTIYSGLYNGILQNDKAYSISFEIAASSSTEQDNKHKPVYLIINGDISEAIVANTINNSLPFTVNDDEIPLIVIFRLVTVPVPKLSTYKYLINSYGKGNYGQGGNVTLIADDMELIFSSVPTTSDVINDPSTDIISIEDLGDLSISQYINQSLTPYVIQDQGDGLTVFQTGTDPNVIAYLFLGDGGTYGFGQSQTTDADFQLITDSPSEPITSTSQIINDGEDGVNPFVTQDDIDTSIATKADLVGGTVPISQLPAFTTSTVTEGSNLYFTTARVLATLLTGISFATGGAIISTDSILVAMGKIQKQITDLLTAIAGKQDTLVSGTNIKTVDGNSLLGSGNIPVSRKFAVTLNRAITPINATWYVAPAITAVSIATDSTTTNLVTALSAAVYGNQVCGAPFNMVLKEIVYNGRGASATIFGVVKGDVVQGTGTLTNTVTVFQDTSYISFPNRVITIPTPYVTIEAGKCVRFSMMHNQVGQANDQATITFYFEELI